MKYQFSAHTPEAALKMKSLTSVALGLTIAIVILPMLHCESSSTKDSKGSVEPVQAKAAQALEASKNLCAVLFFMTGSQTANLDDPVESIKKQFQNGANANVDCQSGERPLNFAVTNTKSNGPAILKILIDHGADVNARDKKGQTPLYSAIDGFNNVEAVELLLKHGAKVNEKAMGHTPLGMAVSKKDASTALISLLIKSGADVNMQSGGITTYPPLLNAKTLEVVRLLVENGADCNIAGDAGLTPLMNAASEGNDDIVKYLLEKGAEVNKKDQQGNTALKFAVEYKRASTIKLLKKSGAKVK